MFDQCVSALVEDLHARGLDRDCTVVIAGEFGRTPKITAQVGRDHWPQANCALLAGGGMRTGQVIGSTDRIAGEAASRPVTWGEVFATLYHNLGIDPRRATLPDLTGRPQYQVEGDAVPLPELVRLPQPELDTSHEDPPGEGGSSRSGTPVAAQPAGTFCASSTTAG